MRHIALLAAATVAGLSVAASAATIDFQEGLTPTTGYVSPDSSIRAAASTTNYDSSGYLDVGGISTQPVRFVISFDLDAAGGLSAGDTIASVKLVLTKRESSGSGWDDAHPVVQVQRLTTPFDATKVSWVDSAASTPWTTAGGDFSSTILSSVSETAAVNATDTFASTANFVAAAQDALDNNNGVLNLIIRAPSQEATSNYVRFWFAQTGTKAYHPILEVTTAVPEPATMGLLVIGGVGALAARRRK
jgi:hypothetical protein